MTQEKTTWKKLEEMTTPVGTAVWPRLDGDPDLKFSEDGHGVGVIVHAEVAPAVAAGPVAALADDEDGCRLLAAPVPSGAAFLNPPRGPFQYKEQTTQRIE